MTARDLRFLISVASQCPATLSVPYLFTLIQVLGSDWINFIVVISLVTHCSVFTAIASWVVLRIVNHLLNVLLSFRDIARFANDQQVRVGASVSVVVSWDIDRDSEAVLNVPHFGTLGSDNEPIGPLFDLHLFVDNAWVCNWVMTVVHNIANDFLSFV